VHKATCSVTLNINARRRPIAELRRFELTTSSEREQALVYRVAQKSKPLPVDQKIVLKPVSEIIFIRQIKV